MDQKETLTFIVKLFGMPRIIRNDDAYDVGHFGICYCLRSLYNTRQIDTITLNLIFNALPGRTNYCWPLNDLGDEGRVAWAKEQLEKLENGSGA